MQKPTTTMPRFRKRHIAITQRLKAYKLTPSGRNLSDYAFSVMSDRQSVLLKATNARARIVVAEFADRQISRLAASTQAPKSLYWITITPRSMSRPYSLAHTFRPEIARGALARIFEGIDYFGMIDVAYFPQHQISFRGGDGNITVGPAVSFHFHLLAWGCSDEDIKRISDGFQDAPSLFDNKKVFYAPKISPEQAVRKNIYQLKMPLKSYFAWLKREHITHPGTGEVHRRFTGEWQTKKRPLRLGEAAKVYNLFYKYDIAELMVGGGAGLAMKRKTLQRAKIWLVFDDFIKRSRLLSTLQPKN